VAHRITNNREDAEDVAQRLFQSLSFISIRFKKGAVFDLAHPSHDVSLDVLRRGGDLLDVLPEETAMVSPAAESSLTSVPDPKILAARERTELLTARSIAYVHNSKDNLLPRIAQRSVTEIPPPTAPTARFSAPRLRFDSLLFSWASTVAQDSEPQDPAAPTLSAGLETQSFELAITSVPDAGVIVPFLHSAFDGETPHPNGIPVICPAVAHWSFFYEGLRQKREEVRTLSRDAASRGNPGKCLIVFFARRREAAATSARRCFDREVPGMGSNKETDAKPSQRLSCVGLAVCLGYSR